MSYTDGIQMVYQPGAGRGRKKKKKPKLSKPRIEHVTCMRRALCPYHYTKGTAGDQSKSLWQLSQLVLCIPIICLRILWVFEYDVEYLGVGPVDRG
jgi:hypothetical protein